MNTEFFKKFYDAEATINLGDKEQSPASINVEQGDKEFLPCPFCGNYPEWVNLAHPSGVAALRCHECQFSIQQDRKDKTLFYWNRRQSPPQPQSSINVDGFLQKLRQQKPDYNSGWYAKNQVGQQQYQTDLKKWKDDEWIKKLEKLPDLNVDEAAEKWAGTNYYKNHWPKEHWERKNAFKAGAEWQSQQPKKSLNI